MITSVKLNNETLSEAVIMDTFRIELSNDVFFLHWNCPGVSKYCVTIIEKDLRPGSYSVWNKNVKANMIPDEKKDYLLDFIEKNKEAILLEMQIAGMK